MNIDAVKGSGSLYPGKADTKSIQQDSAQSASAGSAIHRADKLEISESARALSFQPIKKKIDSKFYDKPEVQREVAMKINREIPTPQKS
jgi:hypothetical protein